jgi:DNA-binding NtrC family response regulator
MRVLEKSQGSTIDEHSSDVLDFSKREFGYVKAGSVLDRHRNDDYILHPGLDHAEPTSRSNRIMVVEDELDVLLTYEVLLAEQGFKVFAFSDPRLALQEFAKNPHGFDLVISDIRMNSMNGIQLYNTLKSIAPDVKIILVSALDAASELSSAIPGFRKENFIAKPVDQTKLTRTINAVLMGTPPLRTSASTKKHSYN